MVIWLTKMRAQGLSGQNSSPGQTAGAGQVSIVWSVKIMSFFGVKKQVSFMISGC
jgi:hypothetical protein